jgi:murein L,D-transpeptidase YcbB/YkuD
MAVPGRSSDQGPAPVDCTSALCRLVAAENLPELRWPDFSDCKTHVKNFYEGSGYALAWVRGGAVTSQAEAIIAILNDAEAKGLNAENYDGPRWAGRLESLRGARERPSDADFARFDLALTVAIMRYSSDLHFGQANPGLFHSRFDVEREKRDLPGLAERLTKAADVTAVLREIEPPFEGYRRTQKALQMYLAMARAEGGERLPVTKKPVEPGSSYPSAAQLARLLRRLGDLPENSAIPPASDIYVPALVDAVKHFQARHGLDADGRIGDSTRGQLNTPLTQRINQLKLTLERWRWVPHEFPRPPIVVNIPEFRLRGLNETYNTEIEMKVVVGKAYRHQTPVFSAELKFVIFRPYWNVPRSILLAEVLPKLRRDRSYLTKNGYEVVNSQDNTVTNSVIDDQTLAQLRSGRLAIRQVPGPKNSLGLVKFLFPNEHNVYLHATPETVLFSKSRRDFSHGCIRVEKPELLAAWVLRDRADWSPEHIAEAMKNTETVQVNLDKTIPILIIYATAVVRQNGEVHFFEDIYGQDASLGRLLAQGYPCSAWKPASGAPGPHPSD